MSAGKRNPIVSGLLAGITLLAGLGTALVGVLAAPVALAAIGALVAYRLAAGEGAPSFPPPRASLTWLGEVGDFVVSFVLWAAPQVPFVAPLIVFVAVTWPLPRSSADSLRFQEQACQIILVLLVGYAIEAGAIRWRDRPVNWILSLVTVGILLAGTSVLLPGFTDRVMLIGGTAILVAAIQGSTRPDADEASGVSPDRRA